MRSERSSSRARLISELFHRHSQALEDGFAHPRNRDQDDYGYRLQPARSAATFSGPDGAQPPVPDNLADFQFYPGLAIGSWLAETESGGNPLG
jgi:hypothetical protein